MALILIQSRQKSVAVDLITLQVSQCITVRLLSLYFVKHIYHFEKKIQIKVVSVNDILCIIYDKIYIDQFELLVKEGLYWTDTD
jgi:hypothetical protein